MGDKLSFQRRTDLLIENRVHSMSVTALAKFSEAIVEYVANLDTAPDKSVSKERFSGEIMSAFDLLFNNWLQSKEAKVL